MKGKGTDVDQILNTKSVVVITPVQQSRNKTYKTPKIMKKLN
jgi:hypothetical protein